MAVLQQMRRFASVGVINTGVAVSVQYMAHWLLDLTVEQAGYVGYGLAIAVSYILNRSWTFASTSRHSRTLLPFIVQSLASAVIYAKLTGYLAAQMPYVMAITIGVAVIFAINFLMARLIFMPRAS